MYLAVCATACLLEILLSKEIKPKLQVAAHSRYGRGNHFFIGSFRFSRGFIPVSVLLAHEAIPLRSQPFCETIDAAATVAHTVHP